MRWSAESKELAALKIGWKSKKQLTASRKFIILISVIVTNIKERCCYEDNQIQPAEGIDKSLSDGS